MFLLVPLYFQTGCRNLETIAADFVRESQQQDDMSGLDVLQASARRTVHPADELDLAAINAHADYSRQIEVTILSGQAEFLYHLHPFQPLTVVLAANEVKEITLWRDYGNKPGRPQSIQVLVGYINGVFHFDIVATRLDPTFSSLTSGFSQAIEATWQTGGGWYHFDGRLKTPLCRSGAADVSFFVRRLSDTE